MGGNRPVISLKELSQFIPCLHFKIGSLQLLKTLLQKKLVNVQNRPQVPIFMCPTFSGDQKRVMFRWEGTLPVSVPVLWPCTSPICFHKTTKDPHGPFKKDWDTHSDLFGHVDYWQSKGRDYSSTRYGHSFTSVRGIFYKLEKISDDTSSRDRISGNDSQFKGNGHFLSIEKITIKKQVSQDLYQNPETTVLEVTKLLDRLT